MEISLIFLLLLLEIVIIVAIEKEKEFNLNQNDYKMTFERLELVRYNKDYVKDMSVVTFKYNRTQAVSNLTATFKVDLGNDMVWVFQTYTFMSNEYRLFPIHFGASFCKALAADVAGSGRLLTYGNFTGCPLVKNKKFHVSNLHPDEKKLPPFIPNGNYKWELQAKYFSKEVFVLNAYATITRPIQWH